MNRAQRIYALHRLFRTHNQTVSRVRIQDELECSQAARWVESEMCKNEETCRAFVAERGLKKEGAQNEILRSFVAESG